MYNSYFIRGTILRYRSGCGIGEVDFGFVNPDAVKGIRTRLIKEDKLMAVLPHRPSLCEQEYVTMQDLAKEPFLLLEEGAFSETLTAFHAEQIEPDIKLRVHDDYSILSMIEEGLGVSIIPELILCKIQPPGGSAAHTAGCEEKNRDYHTG